MVSVDAAAEFKGETEDRERFLIGGKGGHSELMVDIGGRPKGRFVYAVGYSVLGNGRRDGSLTKIYGG